MKAYLIQRDSDLALFCGFNHLSALKLQTKWMPADPKSEGFNPALYSSLNSAQEAQITVEQLGDETALIPVEIPT